MSQLVEVVGKGLVEFPDEFGQDQIKEAIDREYGQSLTAAPQEPAKASGWRERLGITPEAEKAAGWAGRLLSEGPLSPLGIAKPVIDTLEMLGLKEKPQPFTVQTPGGTSATFVDKQLFPVLQTPKEAGPVEASATGLANVAGGLGSFLMSRQGAATMLAPALLGPKLGGTLLAAGFAPGLAKEAGRLYGEAYEEKDFQKLAEALGTTALGLSTGLHARTLPKTLAETARSIYAKRLRENAGQVPPAGVEPARGQVQGRTDLEQPTSGAPGGAAPGGQPQATQAGPEGVLLVGDANDISLAHESNESIAARAPVGAERDAAMNQRRQASVRVASLAKTGDVLVLADGTRFELESLGPKGDAKGEYWTRNEGGDRESGGIMDVGVEIQAGGRIERKGAATTASPAANTLANNRPAVKLMPEEGEAPQYLEAQQKADGTWETHDEIISRNKLSPDMIDRRVFLDQQGNEKLREQTAQELAQQGVTTKVPGEAHSTDVNKLAIVRPTGTEAPDVMAGLAARRPTEKSSGIRWDIRNKRISGLKAKELYRQVGSNEAVIDINGQRFLLDNISRLKSAGIETDYTQRKTTPSSVKTLGDWNKYVAKYPKLGAEDFGAAGVEKVAGEGVTRIKAPTPQPVIPPEVQALIDAGKKGLEHEVEIVPEPKAILPEVQKAMDPANVRGDLVAELGRSPDVSEINTRREQMAREFGFVDLADYQRALESARDPFAAQRKARGQLMGAHLKTGKIQIYPREFLDWLRQDVRPDQWAKAIRSRLSEESIHLKTLPEDALKYWKAMSLFEKYAEQRIYLGKGWRERIRSGQFSATELGFEAIRRRMQRLSRMDSSEVAETAGREKWTVQSLEVMGDAVRRIRESLGTKASAEQLGIINRMIGNIDAAKAAVSGAAPAAARRRPEEIDSLLKEMERPQTIPAGGTNRATAAGLKATSVQDLDALADAFDRAKLVPKQLMASGDLNSAMRAAGSVQLPREAIEAAVNAGSNTVEMDIRMHGGTPKYPTERPLDWRTHPEVADWLVKNAQRLGIHLPEELAAQPAAVRRERAAKKATKEFFLPSVGAGEKVEREVFPLPTGKDIQGIADMQVQDLSERPDFDTFKGQVESRFGALKPGQLYSAWKDALIRRLMPAKGAEIDALMDKVGARPDVAEAIKPGEKEPMLGRGRIPDALDMPETQMSLAEINKFFQQRQWKTKAAYRQKFSPEQRRRYAAIGAIVDKLTQEAGPKPETPLSSTVGPEDVSHVVQVVKGAERMIDESTGTETMTEPEISSSPQWYAFKPEDLKDPQALGDFATRGARVSGKKFTVSNNAMAVRGKDGKIYVLSVFKDTRAGNKIVNPEGAGLTARNIDGRFLQEFTPMVLTTLREPRERLRQVFDSQQAFDQHFGDIGIEGTEGVPASSLTGPQAGIAREQAGVTTGARRGLAPEQPLPTPFRRQPPLLQPSPSISGARELTLPRFARTSIPAGAIPESLPRPAEPSRFLPPGAIPEPVAERAPMVGKLPYETLPRPTVSRPVTEYGHPAPRQPGTEIRAGLEPQLSRRAPGAVRRSEGLTAEQTEKQRQYREIFSTSKNAFEALSRAVNADMYRGTRAEIAKELLKHGDLGVKLEVGGQLIARDWGGIEAAGEFDRASDTVRVYDAAFDANQSGRTLLHEYIHALSHKAISEGKHRAELEALFSAAYRKAIREQQQFHGLSDIALQAARGNLGWGLFGNRTAPVRPEYVPHLQEFVADALSNKRFQDFLSRTRSPLKGGKVRTLFDSFVQWLGKTLGIKNTSALSDTIRIGLDLASERAKAAEMEMPGSVRRNIADEYEAVKAGVGKMVRAWPTKDTPAVMADSASNRANNIAAQAETRVRLASVTKPTTFAKQATTAWRKGNPEVLAAANAMVEAKAVRPNGTIDDTKRSELTDFHQRTMEGLRKARAMSRDPNWAKRRIGRAWIRNQQNLLRELEYAEQHWNDRDLRETAIRASKTFHEQIQLEKQSGIKVSEKTGYDPHRYDAALWDGDSYLFEMTKWQKKILGRKFAETQKFPSYYHAGEAGPYLAVTRDLGSLVGHRVRQGQQRILQNAWKEGLKNVRMPDGRPMAIDPVPGAKRDYLSPKRDYVVVPSANHLAIHEDYAPLVKQLTAESHVELFGPSRTLLHLSQELKHSILVGDFFHLGRMLYYGLATMGTKAGFKSGWSVLDIAERDMPEAVRKGLIRQKDMDWAQQLVPFGKGFMTRRQLAEKFYSQMGANLGRVQDAIYKDLLTETSPTAGKFRRAVTHIIDPSIGRYNRFLFDRLTRGMMAEANVREFERQMRSNPNASPHKLMRDIARDVNNFFGNIGRQGWFKSKTMQDLMRIFWLAPQWVEGLAKKELVGYGRLSGVPYLMGMRRGPQQGYVPQLGTTGRAIGSGMLAMIALTQALNLIFRRQPTWMNEEKEHKFDAWIPGWGADSEGFWMSPLAIYNELSHDLYRLGMSKPTFADAVAQIGGNKEQPVTRAILVGMTGISPMGQKITTTPGRVKEMAKAVAPIPISFGRLGQAGLSQAGLVSPPPPGSVQRQIFATAGVKIEPAETAIQRTAKLAREYMEAEGLTKETGWQQIQTDEPGYSKLRAAIRNDDWVTARRNLQALRKTRQDKDIIKAMKIWAKGGFTGSRKTEGDFMQSLNDQQMNDYDKAQEQKQLLYDKFEDFLWRTD